MRLSQPFFQLPVIFDAARLQAEVAALPQEAWVPHPDGVSGNSAVRLITPGGAETDSVHGRMLPTPWLEGMPFLRQILAGFGVVWGRSRLMRLAPGVGVPEHADINYHWHTRVRMHIPVFTRPEVRFHCDGQSAHMAAGDAWVFDNWRRHHVENNAAAERIHLVADTSGTAAFWQFACGAAPPREQWREVRWNPAASAPLLTEVNQRSPVMTAAEVQLLVEDLRADLTVSDETTGGRERAVRFGTLMENFVCDWRQLCALHGTEGPPHPDFLNLTNAVRKAASSLSGGLLMRSNAVDALLVLEKRVLQHLVVDEAGGLPDGGAPGRPR